MHIQQGKADRTPELLAPAGNLSCAITALESGADAVYAGLDRFNAREGADNFSYEDMSRLAAYAADHGRRYYITLNTLLKDDEVEEAAVSAARIADLRPDAFIVQDPGLATVLRELFPAIPLHASTQMGIHNLAGIETAASLGISRVILERQLDMREIEAIAASSPVEIELFIHGALCCSLSGMCLFSSWMGGWSGNRGRCKQPCRRRFHKMEGGDKESGFFFSTRDLYSLDLISDYRKLGIASLKIEGRLKKEEYVEQVVRAYRLMLDAPPGEEQRYLGEARQILSRSYGRHWSHGFATEQDRRELIQPSSPGVSGLLVGEVVSVRNGAVTAKISRRIHRGDRLRLQDDSGGEASAFLLMEMRKNSRSVTRAEEGDTVTMQLSFDAARGMKIYKVGESRKGSVRDVSGLPLMRSSRSVDVTAVLDEGGLSVEAGGELLRYALDVQEARNGGIDSGMLRELFRATRNEGYRLGSFSADIRGEWFVPPGQLKKVRREFWETVIPVLEASLPPAEDPEEAVRGRFPAVREKLLRDAGSRTKGTAAGGVRQAGTVYFDKAGPEDEALLPFFVPETEMDGFYREAAAAVERGVRRFRLTSLFQFGLMERLLSGAGTERGVFHLTASWPLPVSNGYTAALFGRLGADRVQAWIELDGDGEESLLRSSPVEVKRFVSGRIPLLVTRAEIAVDGRIVDSRGRSFYIAPPGPYGVNVLWSGEGYDAGCTDGAGPLYRGDLLPGYGNPGAGEGTPSRFNREREWK